MLRIELLACILLLIFLWRLVYLATQSLSRIASSTAAINSQLIAFIEGGSTPDEATPPVNDFKNYLTPSHLEFWSYLGQRVYANHAQWLAKSRHEQDAESID